MLARLEAIAAEVRRLLSNLRGMATSNGEIREADAGYLTFYGRKLSQCVNVALRNEGQGAGMKNSSAGPHHGFRACHAQLLMRDIRPRLA